MLTRLELRNFRVLRQVDVDLKPLTVFIGPNACGKSSLLSAALLWSDLARRAQSERGAALWDAAVDTFRTDWPLQKVRSRGATAPMCLSAHTPGRPKMTVCARLESEVREGEEWVTFHSGADEVPEKSYPSDTYAAEFMAASSPARFLNLDSRALAGADYAETEVPTLASNGAGLASLLAHLAATEPDRFRAIQEALRRVVPRAVRVRTPRAEVTIHEREAIRWDDNQMVRDVPRSVWGNRVEVEFEGMGFFEAILLSEGTLLALALLTVLHQSDEPQLILLDDLDRGLHPTAQRTLIEAIRSVQREHPALQVLCTSHSPYLIDCFDPSEVRVMAIGDDGFARCKRLDEHPDAAELSQGLSPGEWWSAVGEAWVRGDG